VFLFDRRPLSNLDAKLRVAIAHRNQGTASAAEDHHGLRPPTTRSKPWTMADKIVVMHDGIVEQIGHAARTLRQTGQSVRLPALSVRRR